MSETVRATSGGVPLDAELDFETGRWTSKTPLPEGEFPFVASADGKRYELYSDQTFAEVEDTPG